MRIRQIALVAADLEPALADLTAVFDIRVGFRDPGVGVFGLHNGVLPVGEQFLEVVSPQQEGTSAGRYLERRQRPGVATPDAGDGGYMVILQTRDLERRRRRFAEKNVRIAWEIAFDDIATAHLHPRDTGGAIVSIDEARPWESWRWAGPAWHEHVSTSRVRGIDGVEIQSDDPERLCSHWADLFELDARDGDRRLVLEDGEWIEFSPATDGRGEGIRSVALRTSDAESIRRAAAARGLSLHEDGSIEVVGVRFTLL
jgi:hypothetical protein